MSQESSQSYIEAESASTSDGNSMQAIAHSSGLLFQQSISNQKNHFNVNSSNLATDVLKILDSNIKKSNVVDRSNIRLLELKNSINQNLE